MLSVAEAFPNHSPAGLQQKLSHKITTMAIKKKYKYLLGLILLLFVLIYLLGQAGIFLVKQDKPSQNADAAVVLMGSIADRVLEAADAYKEGRFDEIIIVNNIQYGSKALEPYGVTIPNFASLSVDALRQLGIPDSNLTLLPGRATSTRDEADTLASWLINNPNVKVLAIISSSAHTRRASMIFKDSFKDRNIDVRVITIPSRYSEFDASNWWQDRESAKQVFMEWVKIISFVAVEQWGRRSE